MFYKLFQKTNAIFYKTFGSKISTQLATSSLGKIIFAVMFKGKGERVYTTDEGIQLKLDPNEAMYLGVALLGSYNQFETKVLKTILKPGDIVIDVGAYVGWYSLLSGKLVGQKGKVYAFEPSPTYLKRFIDNIKLNNLRNIKTFNLAVSNKNSNVSFYQAGSGSSIIKQAAELHIGKKIKQIQVKSITLNTFVAKEKISRINLIKIDVEGWELQVLKGASNILKKKNAPTLMVEVIDGQWKKWIPSTADALFIYLKSFGYVPYIFTKTGLKIYKKEDTKRTLNLLFKKRIKN